MNDLPQDTRYAASHQWVRAERGNVVQVGLTSRASGLGDTVHVTLPTVGATVVAGDALGEIKSTEGSTDLSSPVSGIVVDVNQAVIDNPESLTTESAADFWLFEVELAEENEWDQLMDADSYGEYA